MRKLHLKIEDLAVESFQTNVGGRRAGTVRGHETELETCDFTEVENCTFTLFNTCNSEGSECATCQPFGCPGDTNTCNFGTCGRTNGYQVCFGC